MNHPLASLLSGWTDSADQFTPLLIGAVVFFLLFNMIQKESRRKRRGQWRSRQGWRERAPRRGAPDGWRGSWPPQSAAAGLQAVPEPSRMPDAADQLRTVMGAQFKAKRLLNRGEARVFAALEPIVAELAPGWHVMAQVSLGEVLDADSTEAFNTINAKRVDFLLVDAEMKPRHAIEYQGQGHHQGTAAARDAVKKEALRRAGVGYAEVFADDTPAELRMAVAKIIGVAGRDGPFGRVVAR